jgi:hypothetical protein
MPRNSHETELLSLRLSYFAFINRATATLRTVAHPVITFSPEVL